MTVELWLLVGSIPLYGLYLGTQALVLRQQRGIQYAASARDEGPDKSALEGRADRALRNFNETWPIYIILMLVAHLTQPGDPLVFWGALAWFVARVAYLPLYLHGVFMVRSLVWNVILIALIVIGWGAVF